MFKIIFYRANTEATLTQYGHRVAVEDKILFIDDKCAGRYYDYAWNVFGDPTAWTGFKVEVS